MSDELQHALSLLRLDSGEEIIAKVKELEGAYEVVSAVAIIPIQGEDGRLTQTFAPFMSNAKDATVLLMASHVQAVAVPSDKLEDVYLTYIGDKPQIVKPNKDIILAKS